MAIDKNITGKEVVEFLKNVSLPVTIMEGDRNYNEVHSWRYAIAMKALAEIPLHKEMEVLEMAAEPYGFSACLAAEFPKLTLANYAETPCCGSVEIVINGRVRELTEHSFNVEHKSWPLREETYDLVLACEIIEHLAMDPMALFAGVNRLLKPGGYFFASTPNAASLQNILKLGRMVPAGLAQHFRQPPTLAQIYKRHNREYNPFTIAEMMKAAGFEIFSMGTDSAFPLFKLDYPDDEINSILKIIGMPEMRRDTIQIIGRKVGSVSERYPEQHDLYIKSDVDIF